MNHEFIEILLLNLAMKMTTVLIAGFALASFIRGRSAANRSLLWLVVFAVLALLPLSIWTRPVWSWSLPVIVRVETGKPVMESAAASKPTPLTDPFAPKVAVQTTDGTMNSKALVKAPGLWQIAGGVYSLGVMLILARRLAGEWQVRRLEMVPAGAHIDGMVSQLLAELAIRRRVRVVGSSCCTVPMTWGVLRPMVIMPQESRAWSNEELTAAIRHEVAHIHHHDAAKRWLSTLVLAMFWLHPLVWLAARRWRLEQERACDDFVVKSGSVPQAYASQLLEAARRFRPRGLQSSAALVMAMPFGLETRIRTVISADVSRDATGRFGRMIAMLAGMAAVSFCVLCHAQTAQEKNIRRQIVIKTKFVEVDLKEAGALHSKLESAIIKGKLVLSDKEMQELMRQLSQTKGVDLMTVPTVTTKPGQEAKVEVVREFIYPTELEMNDATLTPVTFEMMPIGVMAEVKPDLGADGRIEIAPLKARVTEFDGFITTGVENLVADGKNKWKVDLSKMPKGKESATAGGLLSATKDLGEKVKTLKPEKLEKDEVSLPLFAIQEWSGAATLKPGEWQMSYLKRLSGDPALHEGRHVWCFVSGEIIEVKEAKKPGPDPKAAQTPVMIETLFVEVADDETLGKAFGALTPISPLPNLGHAMTLGGVLTPQQHQIFLDKLSETKDCRLIASPRVSTLSGKKAVIEIGNEMKYPTIFSADGKKVENTESRRIGISIETTPVLVGGGAIELEIAPSVTEFLGWQIPGREGLVDEEPGNSGPYSPSFSTRKVTTSVTVWPEQRIVMTLGNKKDGKRTLCIIKCELGKPEVAGAVTVFGQVKRQGKYNHKPGMTLDDVLKEAKGVTGEASLLEICRGKGDAEQRIKLDPSKDGATPVLAGDVVIVK